MNKYRLHVLSCLLFSFIHLNSQVHLQLDEILPVQLLSSTNINICICSIFLHKKQLSRPRLPWLMQLGKENLKHQLTIVWKQDLWTEMCSKLGREEVKTKHEMHGYLSLPVLQLSAQSASDGRLCQKVAGQCWWPLQRRQAQQTFSCLFCLVQETNHFSSETAKSTHAHSRSTGLSTLKI